MGVQFPSFNKTPFAVIREKKKLAAIDTRICTPICQGMYLHAYVHVSMGTCFH
jgi:hypothetical protein